MSSIFLRRVRIGSVDRSRDIGRVVHALEDLPEGKGWRVQWEEVKSERSLQQNRYLFGVAYKLISEATGYEKQDIHEDCLKLHFGTRLKKVPRSRNHPDGQKEVPLRTTTTDEYGRRSVLGKMAFYEFVEFVKRYATEADVVIPDPGPDYATRHQEPQQEAA